MNILFNAANLHTGGGIQVATSFLIEFLDIDTGDLNIDIWISTEISSSLKKLGFEIDLFQNIKLVNTYGLSAYFSEKNKNLSKYDLIFTIFGPNYFRNQGQINLVGFAQSWIIDNSAYTILSPFNRIKTKLKFLVQKFFFKRADAFIVELEHVMYGLYKNKIASSGTVYVAYNCLSSLYFNPEGWQALDVDQTSTNIKVGFLGRDYAHKNTSILPDVKRALLSRHGLVIDFFVTFNEQEWACKDENFRSSILNVGSLSVTQCPSFYQEMDAVIFPSLLECFSATPLEAMAMEKPLFASDRRFVRDICGDYAFYFDPHDPSNVADVIATYIHTLHKKDSTR